MARYPRCGEPRSAPGTTSRSERCREDDAHRPRSHVLGPGDLTARLAGIRPARPPQEVGDRNVDHRGVTSCGFPLAGAPFQRRDGGASTATSLRTVVSACARSSRPASRRTCAPYTP
ncbi:hypothetical protein FHS42_002424 [Streptomyces zagrosensis]|uniref:Uncharacterized protein n=1 Tax=Streptomyces zagrosensis TaxID=1042984 RepID=A0A7W9QAC7_9ACTN|nr:hypothetical protein [Streptomyces zagrosensis]